jgi:hypothetical protein
MSGFWVRDLNPRYRWWEAESVEFILLVLCYVLWTSRVLFPADLLTGSFAWYPSVPSYIPSVQVPLFICHRPLWWCVSSKRDSAVKRASRPRVSSLWHHHTIWAPVDRQNNAKAPSSYLWELLSEITGRFTDDFTHVALQICSVPPRLPQIWGRVSSPCITSRDLCSSRREVQSATITSGFIRLSSTDRQTSLSLT